MKGMERTPRPPFRRRREKTGAAGNRRSRRGAKGNCSLRSLRQGAVASGGRSRGRVVRCVGRSVSVRGGRPGGDLVGSFRLGGHLILDVGWLADGLRHRLPDLLIKPAPKVLHPEGRGHAQDEGRHACAGVEVARLDRGEPVPNGALRDCILQVAEGKTPGFGGGRGHRAGKRPNIRSDGGETGKKDPTKRKGRLPEGPT